MEKKTGIAYSLNCTTSLELVLVRGIGCATAVVVVNVYRRPKRMLETPCCVNYFVLDKPHERQSKSLTSGK